MNPIRTPRAHRRAPLRVEVSMESEHNFYTGLSNDISEGGLFIATQHPPCAGEMVDVELNLPEAGHHKIVGIVRWVRIAQDASEGCPAGCGIEWVMIWPEALERIAAFVANRDTIFFFSEAA